MPIVLDGTNGITTPDVESTGPIIGTTGTFSGNVTANGLTTELRPLVAMTAQASTSGTFIDFTGIPSWAKKVTVLFDAVSLSNTDSLNLQIGDSGGIETAGYISGAAMGPALNESQTSNTSFLLSVPFNNNAADAKYGAITLWNSTGNSWVASGTLHSAGYQVGNFVSGSKTLSGVLDRVRILSSGAGTFDGGVINVFWE